MSPEKDIVNLWLNRQGFFTVSDINANNRVVDIIAIRQKAQPTVQHVELHCSVSSPSAVVSEKEKADLLRKFNDSNVVDAVKRTISSYLGGESDYDKVLVTTAQVSLPGITVVRFQEVLREVVAQLDRQNYRSPITRALQLVKFVLMANPLAISSLVSKDHTDKNKPLSHHSKEQLLRQLLQQDAALRLFAKKESEQLIVSILKSSTLKQPERLAAALESILTKRTATRFLNVLLQQKEVKTAIEEEISKDQKLVKFLEA
ncbi:hypothetical protein HYU17_01365 [Candidatus Woesearchaeota archaeon]|nr:hypothetical protein [Candidatus Woesearchaeota archaeon]